MKKNEKQILNRWKYYKDSDGNYHRELLGRMEVTVGVPSLPDKTKEGLFLLGGMHSIHATYTIWSRYGGANMPDWEMINDLTDGVHQVAHWVIKKETK